MKLQRRKFFGLMGGAAIAGPTVAKEAVAKMPSGLGDVALPWGYSSGLNQPVSGYSEGPNKASRILELRRLISGDLTKEEADERRRDRMRIRMTVLNQEIAGLRSVSGVRKVEIFQERCASIRDEIDRSYNMSTLERLLCGE